MKKASIHLNPWRVTALTLIIVLAGSFALWDHYRVNRDFASLKSLLMKTRNEALQSGKTFTTKFSGKDVKIQKGISGNLIQALHVPTLSAVNYDTKLGKDMIVFTSRGTDPYNIKIHGGDMTLRSWFGFQKYLAVNCTGFVSEGLYPDDQS